MKRNGKEIFEMGVGSPLISINTRIFKKKANQTIMRIEKRLRQKHIQVPEEAW